VPVRGLSAPFVFTSVRNDSSLMSASTPCSLSSFWSLAARVLNAPQLLHASIVTELDFVFLAGLFALVLVSVLASGLSALLTAAAFRFAMVAFFCYDDLDEK
jgi:hypothetical protein